MTDFLTTFLASILHEQGVPDPQRAAERAAAELRKVKVVDERAVTRAAIKADPCTDYKIVSRRHHVSQVTVYRVWNSR